MNDDDNDSDPRSDTKGNSDGEEQDEYLFCDALPLNLSVEVNLVDVMLSGGATTAYSGTSTISLQIEEPSNCLIFHVATPQVAISSMKLLQGKHTVRPKTVYSISKSTTNKEHVRAGKRPFRWAEIVTPRTTNSANADQQQQQQQQQEDQNQQQQHESINLSPDKLPCVPINDLRIIELVQPLSYCVVDIVFEFKSALAEDGNGIWLSSARPANTIANGVTLASPTCLIATHFEVDHAHRCFPCIDLTFIRQTVQFSLIVPANAVCRSNGGCGGSQTASSSSSASASATSITKKEHLPPSVRPIPLYVAGFIASTLPLNIVSETVTFPELSPSTTASDDTDAAVEEEQIECSVVTTYDSQFAVDLALKTLIDSVKELRAFLNCGIDVPHLCLVAVPRLILGGMENDCLIFIKESIGVSNQQQPGQGRRSAEAAAKELVRFVVHEVAHHWVGNRIGFSFSWKEGITLVLERYFGNVLLGLPANQGSKGGSSTTESENAEKTGTLVAVDSGKELSGLTYHKAEAAMEAAVRKMGWPAFQAGMQRIVRLGHGEFVPDSQIASFFRPRK